MYKILNHYDRHLKRIQYCRPIMSIKGVCLKHLRKGDRLGKPPCSLLGSARSWMQPRARVTGQEPAWSPPETPEMPVGAQECPLGGKGLHSSLTDGSGSADISHFPRIPEGGLAITQAAGAGRGGCPTQPLLSVTGPEPRRKRWVRRKSVTQRPSQLSLSCPGIEATVLEVSGLCPHLGQCLCISL